MRTRRGAHKAYGQFISDYSDEISKLFFDSMEPVLDKYLYLYNNVKIDSVVSLNDDGSSPLNSELSAEAKDNIKKFNKLSNELNYINYKLDLLNFIEIYKTNITELSAGKKRYSLFTKKREDYLHTCKVCKHVNRIPLNSILTQIHNELIDNYLIGNTIIVEGLGSITLSQRKLFTKVADLAFIKQKLSGSVQMIPARHTNKYLAKYKNYIAGKLFVVKNQEDFDYVKNLNIKEVIKQSGIEDYFKNPEMKTYVRTKIFGFAQNIVFGYEYDAQFDLMLKISNDVFDLEPKSFIELCKNTMPTVLSMWTLEPYLDKVNAKFNNYIIPLAEQSIPLSNDN